MLRNMFGKRDKVASVGFYVRLQLTYIVDDRTYSLALVFDFGSISIYDKAHADHFKHIIPWLIHTFAPDFAKFHSLHSSKLPADELEWYITLPTDCKSEYTD